MEEVESLMSEMENGRNPQEIKRILAEELIERFHDADAAANAHKSAGNVLADGELPVDLPEVTLTLDDSQSTLFIIQILNQAGLAKNSAAAKDMLKRNAVKVDGEEIDSGFSLTSGQTVIIQAGKKAYAKVTLMNKVEIFKELLHEFEQMTYENHGEQDPVLRKLKMLLKSCLDDGLAYIDKLEKISFNPYEAYRLETDIPSEWWEDDLEFDESGWKKQWYDAHKKILKIMNEALEDIKFSNLIKSKNIT